jgi:hypothetical protein
MISLNFVLCDFLKIVIFLSFLRIKVLVFPHRDFFILPKYTKVN